MTGSPAKPPYRVPTMAEVRQVEPNGYRVVSLFAGGGGSSTGYRMAGFRVLYANEFVPAAQETYRANARPDTIIDGHDIREVTGTSILDQIGLRVGELDVLDGSPPCASFSVAGKRSKKWGEVSAYSDTRQRTDDLFFEYARLLAEIRPKVFVAENVSGLVRGVSKGYFKRILGVLADAGYRVEARVLDASWLGVPQSRQRLIFIGVRDDLPGSPVHPTPLPYRYPLREVLPGLVAVRRWDFGKTIIVPDDEPAPIVMAHGIGGVAATQFAVSHDTSGQFSQGDVTDKPCPAILTGPNALNSRHYQVRDGEQITHDPETGEDIRIGRYAIGAEWARLVQGQGSDKYLIRPAHGQPSPTVTATAGAIGAAGVTHPDQPRKFTLIELRAICGFPPDYVLTGTYAQRWERLGRSVPPLMMRAVAEVIRDRVLPSCAA